MKQHSLNVELVSDSLLHRVIAFESILRHISLVYLKQKKIQLFFFFFPMWKELMLKKKIHTVIFKMDNQQGPTV